MSSSNTDRTQEFVSLLLATEPQLYGFLCAQLVDRNDADDVFQETAKILWQKFDDFERGTNFVAWAMQIAKHKVLHHQTRVRRERRFSADVLELMAHKSEELTSEILDLRGALADCMEKLPANDRDVVRRCYVAGVTVRAVADELDKPFETVKSILKRSRRALFECIQRTLAREAR